MALLRDVIFKAGPKLSHFIQTERNLINLKAVKKMTLSFDPFSHESKSIRDFSYHIHFPETLKTNSKCIIKTEILSDRSEPTITFDLIDKQTILFKCGNLSCLQILQLVNEHISILAPKEEVVAVIQTKQLKKKKS